MFAIQEMRCICSRGRLSSMHEKAFRKAVTCFPYTCFITAWAGNFKHGKFGREFSVSLKKNEKVS